LADEDDLPGNDRIRFHFDDLLIAQHACRLRQEIQHVLNGAPATAYGESFKNLGGQDESGNNQRGKKFSDGKCGDQRDGHGKLHGHAALDDVLECLLEDWVATDECSCQSDHADAVKRFPEVKPHCCGRKRYKDDPEDLCDFKTMFMVMMVVRIRRFRQMDAGFGDLAEVSRYVLLMCDSLLMCYGHGRLRTFS
jgi:hypothetical protein